ncbi:Ig-like domain-containing protein [Candidatus Amarobacter glycogenicus]|uniref:Ig-like domain-containing protein n=1 Tax=Candidatus Amarobacter glycogenicus TaxID=3140699 RepID=UPI0031360906|nr:Ig-like domain repeat protein [Dehalococcoidia bacterium]
MSPDCSACVQFKVGALQSSAVAIGTPQNVASGTANLTGVTTGGGTGTFGSSGGYVIWAEYTANTNLNAASDSGNLTLAQPVDLTVSAPAIVQVNTAATLSATVSPASAPGTVQFKVNGTNHGSPQTLSSGAASISWTPTASGSYSITATYNSSSTTYLDDDTSNTATVAVPAAVTITISAAAAVTVGAITQRVGAGSPGTVRFFGCKSRVVAVSADTRRVDFLWTPSSSGGRQRSGHPTSSANYRAELRRAWPQPALAGHHPWVTGPAPNTTCSACLPGIRDRPRCESLDHWVVRRNRPLEFASGLGRPHPNADE